MTTTQQGQFEAVSTDGAVADETDSSSHTRDSDTTGSYADLLIQITEQSSTTRAAGTRWEQVVVSFLSTDPLYRRRFASVEPFADWAARNPTRGTSQDRGIDLIATRHDGKPAAIQCKFTGDISKKLSKGAVDSFLANTENRDYAERLVVFSGFEVTRHLEEQLAADREIPVQLLAGKVLSQANVTWGELTTIETGMLARRPLKTIRPHQRKAVDKAKAELAKAAEARTKLVMACGSGKTYTSLILAEEIAGPGKRVLYAVPSIALLGQTMRSWAEEEDREGRGVKHSYIGVCSDPKTGKRGGDGTDASDLAQMEFSVTTDPDKIHEALCQPVPEDTMQVVFCTYQSLPQIRQAQNRGAPDFFLALADEAHRTTGVENDKPSLATAPSNGELPKVSPFQIIHNHIKADKRVYMTATPKVFSEASKARKSAQNRAVWSMDDPEIFGETCHELSFSKAITKDLLSDYKVVLAQSPASLCQDVLAIFLNTPEAQELDEKDAQLLTEGVVAQMIGLYNTLRGNSHDRAGWDPLYKTIVYTNRIVDSKRFAAVFPVFAAHLDRVVAKKQGKKTASQNLPAIAVRHVDGGMGANQRAGHLHWLDSARQDGEIRILSNAKCLSEGVDVPSLDALCFLQPKGSHIDIVQSVGRVMRKVPHKNFGYVVLPLVLPDTIGDYGEHIRKDDFWKTTWAVLRALRSHDERFARELGVMELDGDRWPKNLVCITTQTDLSSQVAAFADSDSTAGTASTTRAILADEDDPAASQAKADGMWQTPEGKKPSFDSTDSADDQPGTPAIAHTITHTEPTLPLDFSELLKQHPEEALSFVLAQIRSAVVEKVGDRQYWHTWSQDAHTAYETILARIERIYAQHPAVKRQIDQTTEGLEATLGERATVGETISILAQYIVIKPVFEALFGTAENFEDSPLSTAMSQLHKEIRWLRLENETAKLESFYQSVIDTAKAITRPEDKQTLIKRLYEDFIRTAFPEAAKDYGVVYTPNELVNFVLRSVDWSLKEELGIADGLADENVEILDPFAGTGTFLVNLIQNEHLLPDDKLPHTYKNNLHTTEIMALPYWATELNMEQAYQARRPQDGYVPFENGVLADTFQMYSRKPKLTDGPLRENQDRAAAQDDREIKVIVGNPPWNVAKICNSELVEKRISETYCTETTASSKTSLFDSYVMAIRWASDRIGEKGVIGFVTNNGWLTGNAASGLRRTLEKEFDHIHFLNLRGELERGGNEENKLKEGGNVFAITVGVQIVILARTSRSATLQTKAHYADMAYLPVQEKLARLNGTAYPGDTTGGLEWIATASDYRGDWLEQGNSDFSNNISMGDAITKATGKGESIFSLYSGGLKTAMDEFVVNSDPSSVEEQSTELAEEFNFLLDSAIDIPKQSDVGASWHRDVKNKIERQRKKPSESREYAKIDTEHIRRVMFRPWTPQYTLWHKTFNSRQYRLNDIYDAAQPILHRPSTIQLEAELVEQHHSANLVEHAPPPRHLSASQAQGHQNLRSSSQSFQPTSTSSQQERNVSPDSTYQRAICIASLGHSVFDSIMTELPPDLHLNSGATQCFPRYRLQTPDSTQGGIFEDGQPATPQTEVEPTESTKSPQPSHATATPDSLEGTVASDGRVYVDNILDTSLKKFQTHYGDNAITKDDIFYYVYGILHHEGYRQKYKNDLTKELPRIPFAPDFWSFANIGRQLGDLHCDYDKLEGWQDLKVEYSDEFDPDNPDHWQITNAKFEGEDKQTLHLNQHITIRNIPPAAYDYKIANKAPIEQFASEMKIKTYEESNIINDRNQLFAHNPPKALLRAQQLIEVGIRTTHLLSHLPPAFEPNSAQTS